MVIGKAKWLILALSLFLSVSVQAQWFFGTNIGTTSLDQRDYLLSQFRFESAGFVVLNPEISYQSDKHKFTISYLQHGFTMDRFDGSNTERLEGMNYEMDISYFRKVYSLSSKTDIFLGVSQGGHFSYYDYFLQTSWTNQQEFSYEMNVAGPVFHVLSEFELKDSFVQYQLGFGFLSYGSRPESLRENRNYNLEWHTYNSVNSSLRGWFPLSENVTFKAEFRLKYHRFENPETQKLLRRYFTAGLFWTL